jgi:hypothetical protein
LRYILQGGLDDFQNCFIDSTAVQANTERPTDSTLLVRLIARVCTSGGNLHRLDLPDMNQIGLLEQQQELRRLLRRVRRLRKRLLRDLESVRRNLEGRVDLPPSRRLRGQEVLGLISEDLAALEQAANVCERRVMEQEKVPVAEKIISLSDSDASFIVKGGWNTVLGYRPQLARSGAGFCHGACVASW